MLKVRQMLPRKWLFVDLRERKIRKLLLRILINLKVNFITAWHRCVTNWLVHGEMVRLRTIFMMKPFHKIHTLRVGEMA